MTWKSHDKMPPESDLVDVGRSIKLMANQGSSRPGVDRPKKRSNRTKDSHGSLLSAYQRSYPKGSVQLHQRLKGRKLCWEVERLERCRLTRPAVFHFDLDHFPLNNTGLVPASRAAGLLSFRLPPAFRPYLFSEGLFTSHPRTCRQAPCVFHRVPRSSFLTTRLNDHPRH